jgi:hypothetical protein
VAFIFQNIRRNNRDISLIAFLYKEMFILNPFIAPPVRPVKLYHMPDPFVILYSIYTVNITVIRSN